MLTARDVTVRLSGRTIVDRVSFTLAQGEWLMLCGPNGAGKSTLVEALSGAIPCEGAITLCGRDRRAMRADEVARRLGVLSQNSGVAYPFTVEEVVAMGRYAYQRGPLGGGDPGGADAVDAALREVGLTALRRRSMLTLSGGERQRAFLAQALCQDPDVLMLDEPGNHLDLAYQKQLFTLIDAWRRRPGKAAVSVVHDLAVARRFGTRALLLSGGKCVAAGPVREALCEENLRAVWGLDVGAWMRGLYAAWNDGDDEAGG